MNVDILVRFYALFFVKLSNDHNRWDDVSIPAQHNNRSAGRGDVSWVSSKRVRVAGRSVVTERLHQKQKRRTEIRCTRPRPGA